MKLLDVDPKDYTKLGLPDPESLPIGTPEAERFAPTKFRTPDGQTFVRVQSDGKWVWREQTMKREAW
jgi:hypothetical protein